MERRLRPIHTAVLWNAVLLIVGWYAVPPVWFDTDDVRMAMIASGVGSPDGPSELLVYSNVLIGKLLKSLSEHNSNVAWYGLYLLTIQAISHISIVWCVLTLRPGRLLTAGLAIVHVAVVFYFQVHLQFTNTASLAAIAGASLVALAFHKEARSDRSTLALPIAGWTLILVAGLIRIESCGLICLLSVPLLLCLLRTLGSRRCMLRHATIGTIALSVLLGCVLVDRQAYQDDPAWSEFRRLHRPTAKIANNAYLMFLTSGGPRMLVSDRDEQLARHTAELKNVGLTPNDLQCLFWWLYFDEDVFTADRVEQLQDRLLDSPLTSQRMLIASLGLVALLSGSSQFLLMIGTAIAVLLCCGTRGRRLWITISIWLLGLAVLLGILAYMKLPARVFVPAATACMMSTIVFTLTDRQRLDTSLSGLFSREPTQEHMPRSVLLGYSGLTVAAIFAVIASYEYYERSRSTTRKREILHNELGTLSTGDRFHVMTVPFPFDRLSPLDSLNRFRSLRFVYLDGHLRSPRQEAILKANGITSLSESLIASRDLVLISSKDESQQKLSGFYGDHYDMQLEFELQHKMTGFSSWQIHATSTATTLEHAAGN